MANPGQGDFKVSEDQSETRQDRCTHELGVLSAQDQGRPHPSVEAEGSHAPSLLTEELWTVDGFGAGTVTFH